MNGEPLGHNSRQSAMCLTLLAGVGEKPKTPDSDSVMVTLLVWCGLSSPWAFGWESWVHNGAAGRVLRDLPILRVLHGQPETSWFFHPICLRQMVNATLI